MNLQKRSTFKTRNVRENLKTVIRVKKDESNTKIEETKKLSKFEEEIENLC